MLRLTIIVLFVVVGCSKKSSQPNIEVIQDMMEQPALKAQDFHPHDREKSSMLTPPKGTVAKNKSVYPYSGNPEGAAANLKNPYGQSKAFLNRGKINYNNFCMVCHGETGKGDGPVAAKWMIGKIPALVTDKAKAYPEGKIFHIITEGQGLMGSYIHQLPEPKERWAVVSYIRKLQGK